MVQCTSTEYLRKEIHHNETTCQNKLGTVYFFSGVPKEYDLINIICPSPIGLKASETKVWNQSKAESTSHWNKWQKSYQDWASHLELLNKRSIIVINTFHIRSWQLPEKNIFMVFFVCWDLSQNCTGFLSFHFHLFLYFSS